LAGQTSTINGRGAAPVFGALARGAGYAAPANLPSARVDERSPAPLRRGTESPDPLILLGREHEGDGRLR
jgi:hypothetical protein